MLKTSILALGLVAFAAPALACTSEELTAKATELSNKMQALMATDPAKASEIGQKMAALQTQPTTDAASACETYDKLLAELD